MGSSGLRVALRLLLLLILLLAAALRFHCLDAQSFWNDEGNTARLVERPLSLIIAGAAGDIHPPGYYLLLHAWRAATGESEFALRAFSVLCGWLTVALAAALGRKAGGDPAAIGAALFVAVNPLAVYYSQEARMYALLGLAGALALWSGTQLIAAPSWKHAAALAAAVALGLYTQYAFVFALAGLNLAFGVDWLWGSASSPTGDSASSLSRPLSLPKGRAHNAPTGGSASSPTGSASVPPRPLSLPKRRAHNAPTGGSAGSPTGDSVSSLSRPLSLPKGRAHNAPTGGSTGSPTGDSVSSLSRPLSLPKGLPHWLAAHLLAGLAFLPWTPIALRASGWRPPDLDASGAVGAMARTLLAGITLPAKAAPYLLLPALGLLALTMLTRSRRPFIAWAAALMALLPAALIAALGIYRPAYLKFLMISVAPLGVLLALPLARAGWRRWLAALLLLALLPTQVTALQHLFDDPAYARDDYRGLAATIAAGQPGDAILLNAPNQWEVFTYYYRGPLPVYPAPYHPAPEAAATWVSETIAGHRQLFVLYWGDAESDPGRHIELELAQQAYKATDIWVGKVRLARYGVTPLPTAPTIATTAQLGETVLLEGADLGGATYAPGDIIPMTLFWNALAAPGARLKVFVHLLAENGVLVAQADAEPLGGFRPTDSWQPGEQLHDRYGVLLPDDLPPGHYTLIAGMYDFAGARQPVTRTGQAVGDSIWLGQISIQP